MATSTILPSGTFFCFRLCCLNVDRQCTNCVCVYGQSVKSLHSMPVPRRGPCSATHIPIQRMNSTRPSPDPGSVDQLRSKVLCCSSLNAVMKNSKGVMEPEKHVCRHFRLCVSHQVDHQLNSRPQIQDLEQDVQKELV